MADGTAAETMTDVRDFTSTSPTRPTRIAFRVDSTFDDDVAVEDPPENYVMENIADHIVRPRALSHHLSSVKSPSRRWLTVQARFWRACMGLGMLFHGFPSPRPPKPAFVHKIETDTIPIKLYFYVPPDYHTICRDKPDHRYPVVVNFHGGGFSLGHATDDKYYARVILEHTSAIFVSVDYRRAPEHPFPIPVDDSVEALLYLAVCAEEYHIDPSKIALTGFSAGANLSLTVPFRLAFHTDQVNPAKYFSPDASPNSTPDISPTSSRQERPIAEVNTIVPPAERVSLDNSSAVSLRKSPASSATTLLKRAAMNSAAQTDPSGTNISLDTLTPSTTNSLRILDSSNPNTSRPKLIQIHSSSRIERLLNPSTTRVNQLQTQESIPQSGFEALKILSIVSWYPLLDWTSSRSFKRRSAVNPAKTLNPLFTNLFDYSYLPPPDVEANHLSPYASPGLARNDMLVDGLPQRIQLWLCEYDMLLQEGREFSDRLEKLGKDVTTTLVKGVPHGWDKSPNPFRDQSKIDKLYIQAAERLEEAFEGARQKPYSVAGERIGLGGRR